MLPKIERAGMNLIQVKDSIFCKYDNYMIFPIVINIDLKNVECFIFSYSKNIFKANQFLLSEVQSLLKLQTLFW